MGQFYDKYLSDIKLNEIFVPFTSADLSYLHADTYSDLLGEAVCAATAVRVEEVVAMQEEDLSAARRGGGAIDEVDTATRSLPRFLGKDADDEAREGTRYVVEYCSGREGDCGDGEDFVSVARALGLFDDVRPGVPRGAYMGVVTFRIGYNVVFLVERGGRMASSCGAGPLRSMSMAVHDDL